jgi:hypothetical protein
MNYFVTACNYLEIDEVVAYEWMRKGEAGDDAAGDWPEAYRAFAQSVKRGAARGEAAAVAEINRHGRPHEVPEGQVPGQWQALMTLLERRFPDRWSRGERREITGAGGGPVAHSIIFEVVGGEEAAGEPDSDSDGD